MNIKNKSNKNKGLLAVGLFITLFVVVFGVVTKNVKFQEKSLRDEYHMKLEEKDLIVSDLEQKLKESKSFIENSTQENKDKLSETALDRQNKYIQVSNEFIDHYLNYNTKTLGKRRENLLEITSEKLIDHVAPEPSEEENALSSDPSFTSETKSVKTFVSNEAGNTSEVISEVHYLAKSTEGETEVKSIVKLKLVMEDGVIKVTEYSYYPINK